MPYLKVWDVESLGGYLNSDESHRKGIHHLGNFPAIITASNTLRYKQERFLAVHSFTRGFLWLKEHHVIPSIKI